MRSPAHDLALYLETQDVGTFGSDLHVSREPASPDFAVTLYDTGGSEPDADMNLFRPTIQVRVRSYDYAEAYAKQAEIRDIFILPEGSIIFGEVEYVGVFMASDIISIGRDDNDRHILTANYRLLRAEEQS